MNPDGTPLVVDPKDKGEASSEVKSFTSQDLERALAKQKEEHDASLEALVQLRLATLSAVLGPHSSGVGSRPTVPTSSLGQQPPSNEHASVPWLYARPQVEKPRYNPQGKPPLLTATADFALWKVAMQDHLRHGNDEMLEIMEYGYHVVDPKNPTPREIYDKNLNDTAIMCISKGMMKSKGDRSFTSKVARNYGKVLYDPELALLPAGVRNMKLPRGNCKTFVWRKVKPPINSLSVS